MLAFGGGVGCISWLLPNKIQEGEDIDLQGSKPQPSVTKDESRQFSGNRVNLQGFPDNGLNVNNWNENANANIGVAASRQFFKSLLRFWLI